MPSARKDFSMDHPVVITFLIFAIIGFMYLAGEVLKPLALAILLSLALAPLCIFLERRGLPRFVAVLLTLGLTIGLIVGVGFKVGQQLDALANTLPKYEENVREKLKRFQVGGETAEHVKQFVGGISETVAPKEEQDDRVMDVRVVNNGPSLFKQVTETIGPYLESVGVLAFVLVLVMFILNTREDLSDRLIRLFGRGKISLTTKTMEEAGQRISRYLTTFALVNSSVGVIVGLGLWAIGLPYPLVWGVLAAMLRFVPYAGPATAFVLPFAFSTAHFPNWHGPLLVLALFGTLEAVANSFAEPMIYGKSTGVSALGLLVAAMFWTWLWGALGLLLSTPMTVCLAVMGKYVPALKVFATFLGEETPLKPDVRFYQRLLARDQDGATTLVEESLKETPRAKLFDEVFVPTLSMAERDSIREDIDERERDFVWWVVDEIVQDLDSTPPGEPDLAPTAVEAGPPIPEPAKDGSSRIVGVPANDKGDLLALKMLQVLLGPSGCRMELGEVGVTPLKLTEWLADQHPTMIVVSHLPPAGLTPTRYLVRRLRARFPDVPILVGRWAVAGEGDSADRLGTAGASQVVATLAEARDRILNKQPHAAEAASKPGDIRLPEPAKA